MTEQISYAKTVYGQKEIDAVVKCLKESTQNWGNNSNSFHYLYLVNILFK